MSTEQFCPHDASSSFNNTQLTLHSVHQRNNTLFEGIFVVQFCRSLLDFYFSDKGTSKLNYKGNQNLKIYLFVQLCSIFARFISFPTKEPPS